MVESLIRNGGQDRGLMTKSQGRILWCDAEANFHRLSSLDLVAETVEKAKRARINTLVVDVKPLSGEVLYTSRYAPRFHGIDAKQFPGCGTPDILVLIALHCT